MAHFSRTRADAAAWGDGTAVDATEYDELDAKCTAAINGDGGGVFAPSSVIEVGGSGIDCTGPFTADDMVDCHVQAGEVLTIDGTGRIQLDATGYINCDVGAFMDVYGSVDVQNGGDISCKNGSDLILESGSECTAQSGSAITFESGSLLDFESGSDIHIQSGADISVLSGGSIIMSAGADLTISDITDVVCATRSTYTNFQAPDMIGDDIAGLATTFFYPYNDGTTSCRRSSAAGVGAVQVGTSSLPQLATVTAVHAQVKGAAGHAALPANMPQLRLYRAASYGVLTLLSSQTDTSGGTGAYQTGHLISMTSLSYAVKGASGNLIVMVTNESGANSLAAFDVYQIIIEYDITTVAWA